MKWYPLIFLLYIISILVVSYCVKKNDSNNNVNNSSSSINKIDIPNYINANLAKLLVNQELIPSF